LSAVLYGLAFPPANAGLLVFVALVPWLVQLRTVDGKAAFKTGLWFGVLFWTYQMIWLQPFVGRWTDSAVMGAIPWLLCAPVGMWYFGFAGWLMQRSMRMGMWWLIPLVWAGVEVIRAYFPVLAYPWGLLAHPLWFLPPLIQGASYGQIFAVSAWVMLVNVLVVMLVLPKQEKKKRQTLQLSIVAIAFLFLSLGRYQLRQEGQPLKVAVGQPGVDLAFGNPHTVRSDIRLSVGALLSEAESQGAALLVLPEGLTSGSDTIPQMLPFPLPKIPTLFGGQRGRRPSYQSAYAFNGSSWDYADKTRLVVFGEFVPGREYLPFLQSFHLPSGDLQAGSVIKLLDLGVAKVGPVICFEELFPYIPEKQAEMGAQLIAVISVDDWFMGTPAPDQLASACVWRAVENGLPMVRSASIGYSFVCDGRGNVLARAEPRRRELLTTTLALPEKSDAFPYRWVFPYVGLLAVGFAIVAPFAFRKEGERRQK